MSADLPEHVRADPLTKVTHDVGPASDPLSGRRVRPNIRVEIEEGFELPSAGVEVDTMRGNEPPTRRGQQPAPVRWLDKVNNRQRERRSHVHHPSVNWAAPRVRPHPMASDRG